MQSLDTRSMRICLVSESGEISPPLIEIREAFTVLAVKPTESIPDAALYIWDYVPGLQVRSQLTAKNAAQHLILCDPKYLDTLGDLQTCACVLLKPLTAFTLKAFAELARKSWQLRKQANDADNLRSDRDALLQYVLEVNLRLQEYDQERNNFLARALHDFRTPLTAVDGYCGLLSDGKLGTVTSAQRDLLNRMRDSTKRLTRMTTGAMELLLEGRFEKAVARRLGEIGETLTHAIHDVYPFIKEKEIELRIDIQPPGAPLMFEAEQIQQVLVNLLENACKFTPRKGMIEVRSYPTCLHSQFGRPGSIAMEGDNGYRVEISDSGPGVPPHLADKIFEQYVSYSGPSDRTVGGLGLAICRLIVNAHSGSIWATPNPNGGRFTFTLPLCAPMNALPAEVFAQMAPEFQRVIPQ